VRYFQHHAALLGKFSIAAYNINQRLNRKIAADEGSPWESLAQNHPFIDGNKRTAFAGTYTFLAINGARIAADAKAAYVFIAGLYETNDFTFEKLAAWLRDNVEPASP
jgi:death-on-curing protein